MRWIALALLVSLAAAIWWFDAPWPTRSVHWDQRYAAAAARADCGEELALIRVGIEADYPPAATALGELAERNACGYRTGQFDYQAEGWDGQPVQGNQIDWLLSSYAQSTGPLRSDLHNGWFLRTRGMAWLDAVTRSEAASPHRALLRVASECADHLLDSSYATHWAALESSMQDNQPDPHRTAQAVYRQQQICREVFYESALVLRTSPSWQTREAGRFLHADALYLGYPQAIADCMDFVPAPPGTDELTSIEPVIHCPNLEPGQLLDWAGRGDAGARARWLETLDTRAWETGQYSGYDIPSPLWVAIHATIADHPIREIALTHLRDDCADTVDIIAERVRRLQSAQSPATGPVIDQVIRDAWLCEPDDIRAHHTFENYYPNEAFPPHHERWTAVLDPASPDRGSAG
ncbi:hypothetical protein [Maricaulis sp.]|uniref:hypothetical protein n=1 Tax=Maricaulis sp. TaxID=1486257 RepID=UPI003A8D0C3A